VGEAVRGDLPQRLVQVGGGGVQDGEGFVAVAVGGGAGDPESRREQGISSRLRYQTSTSSA
jgi:hypothetical protein